MSAFVEILKLKKLFVKAKIYRHPLLLAKGLRFSRPLKKDEALLLASSRENLQTIDMLFVFFPIDAVWLDKHKRVVHRVCNIKPFTVAVSSPRKAQYILECPANTASAIKRGEKLSFVLHQ